MAAPVPPNAFCVMPEPLEAFATDVFKMVDLPDPDAALIAHYLVGVDLRGVSSHGTRQLRRYVPEFQNGLVNTRPDIGVVNETPVSVVLDGDGGAGYLAATQATERVIEKAKQQGIAMAATRNHGHVGSEGIYARLAHDLVTFSVAGGTHWSKPTDADATVWDAMKAPPMCFGIPSEGDPPFVFDANANMLRDPSRLAEALETFPDFIFKSLGFKFVSTLLGGVLAGTVPEGDRKFSGANRGFLIVALDPGAVRDASDFKREVSRIVAETRSLKPMPGLPSAELPGSLEWQREQIWRVEGIPLAEDHKALLESVATTLNLSVPWEA
ncbi:MAG: hypothetical protein HN521_23735 [Candidatus Latescibacteria bacterium]|jgi:L-2-hydroxycarboxylate dehydrogenase (NAD+)|nr:hypothetical protein [Candidatus Latescibacterota bacterium]